MKLLATFVSILSVQTLATAAKNEEGGRFLNPLTSMKANDIATIQQPSLPSPSWFGAPSTTMMVNSKYQCDNGGIRVICNIPRGGGWFEDAAKEVESSAASAKAKAKAVYTDATAKAKDEVAKAKETANKAWMKRVEDLEQRLREEKTKASERLEAEKKRLIEQKDKEVKKLESRIKELQGKLEEAKKKQSK